MLAQSSLAVAVAGAGVIGREHAARLTRNPRARLAAIVDPSPATAAFAASLRVPFFATIAAMLEAGRPSAAIVATPTSDHASTAVALLEAGVPVLVEKPLAGDLTAGASIVVASARTGLPVLVGYHRRHSPAVRAARDFIAGGHVGRVVAVTGTSLFHKPGEYFETAWRTGPNGGPVLINLAHEIDMLRLLVGEIGAVQSIASRTVRGLPVEDTAAVILEFECGAVATLAVSDCTAAPFSWEQTSGENPAFAREPAEDSLRIAGAYGALALPSLRWWRQEDPRSWSQPFQAGRLEAEPADPLDRQLDHFLDAVEGRAAPVASAADALRSLAATLAVLEAARTGAKVVPGAYC
ncbi:MAG: Gfo/Idh/MocA family oxidoreductase [Bryobacteraceae bacterium]